MTIERFGRWGDPIEDAVEVDAFANDSELASAAHRALEDGNRLQAAVNSGDLLKTLGLEAPRNGNERHQYPIDLGMARPLVAPTSCKGHQEDDGWWPFVAHAVAGRPLGPGWFCVAMNTPWLGSWRLGPRAHPNDDKLDITSGSLPIRQLPEARRRAKSGSHLPHPMLGHQRRGEFQIPFRRAMSIQLDGEPVGKWSGLEVKTIPDAALLIV